MTKLEKKINVIALTREFFPMTLGMKQVIQMITRFSVMVGCGLYVWVIVIMCPYVH